MQTTPEIMQQIPFFSLLDKDELEILAAQVELKTFAPRQRVHKLGEPGGRAYILISGAIRVTAIDEDQQEVVVEEPRGGDFVGFASLLDESPHQTDAFAIEETVCIEVTRDDLSALVLHKPHAGMDLLTSLGRQLHSAQRLVRIRSARNPNEIIEQEETFGERVADGVARFGGSWGFIILFFTFLVTYTIPNIVLGQKAWDPYPFILLNLFLSMLAAIQAPVIMMSQNRQDQKDRLRSELDFEVNRRAESEIQRLSEKIHLMNEKMGDVEDLIRQELALHRVTPN